MQPDKHNRRKFLKTLGAGAAAGLLMDPPASGFSNTNILAAAESEYLFGEGITYLNTGTLGPCRRETIEASMKAWDDLETLPVKFYGKFGAEELAEKTRTTARARRSRRS